MKELNCRKCGHTLGHLDGGVFVTGGIRLYGRVKVFCDFCGRPFVYVETLPEDLGHPEGAQEIINGLGKDYSASWHYQKEQPKRKKLEENG